MISLHVTDASKKAKGRKARAKKKPSGSGSSSKKDSNSSKSNTEQAMRGKNSPKQQKKVKKVTKSKPELTLRQSPSEETEITESSSPPNSPVKASPQSVLDVFPEATKAEMKDTIIPVPLMDDEFSLDAVSDGPEVSNEEQKPVDTIRNMFERPDATPVEPVVDMQSFYKKQTAQIHKDSDKKKETLEGYHVASRSEEPLKASPSKKATSAPKSRVAMIREKFENPGDSSAFAPSPASTEEATGRAKSEVMVEYKDVDYRGFAFVVHDQYGMMMLHCTRKSNKPPHYQLPGGHIDDAEFVAAARLSSDPKQQLLHAAKAGTAREIFEETGIDVRADLDRLEPAILRSNPETSKKGKELLQNEYKQRLFFFLNVTDADFITKEPSADQRVWRPTGGVADNLMLKLSMEHSSWTFEKEPTVAAELLTDHSGGKVSEALLMAMGREHDGTSSSNKEKSSTKERGLPADADEKQTQQDCCVIL